jgi:hypothetical protein
VSEKGGEIRVETPFIVARILLDGETSIFATGVYKDLFRPDGGVPKLNERIALKIGSKTVEGPQPAVLLCQGKPLSDVVIRPYRIERRNTAALRTIKARVFRIDRAAPNVVTLLLRFAVPAVHRRLSGPSGFQVAPFALLESGALRKTYLGV